MSCVVRFACDKTTTNIRVDAAVNHYLLEAPLAVYKQKKDHTTNSHNGIRKFAERECGQLRLTGNAVRGIRVATGRATAEVVREDVEIATWIAEEPCIRTHVRARAWICLGSVPSQAHPAARVSPRRRRQTLRTPAILGRFGKQVVNPP